MGVTPQRIMVKAAGQGQVEENPCWASGSGLMLQLLGLCSCRVHVAMAWKASRGKAVRGTFHDTSLRGGTCSTAVRQLLT